MPKKVRSRLTRPKRSRCSHQSKVKSSTDSVQPTNPPAPLQHPQPAALLRRNLTSRTKVEDSVVPVRRSNRGGRAIESTSSHQPSEILLETSSSDDKEGGPSVVETSPSTLSLEGVVTVPSVRRSVRVRTSESGSKSLSKTCSHSPS